jgi:FkbM family methyltransferase
MVNMVSRKDKKIMMVHIRHKIGNLPLVIKIKNLWDFLFYHIPQMTKGPITEDVLKENIYRDDPIILDIGCNDGSTTRWFLSIFPKARVYCFEPDPRARKRFLTSGQDERATLFSCAIGNSDEIRDFYQSGGVPIASPERIKEFPEGWDFSGSIRRPKEHRILDPGITFNHVIKVEMKKLDTWIQEMNIGKIDLIWADVQGAEIDLILGGQKALANTLLFYTEYSNHELYEGQINLYEIVRLLREFEIIKKYKYDVLFRNKKLDRQKRKKPSPFGFDREKGRKRD